MNALYNKKYFLEACDGYRQFQATRGQALPPRLKKVLELAQLRKEESVLDIGCGRGELVLHSGDQSAFAVGVDFAPEALSLCNLARRSWKKKRPQAFANSDFVCANAVQLPFAANTLDCVILSDVVEHLSSKAFQIALHGIAQVLKPGGRVVIHTSPNKVFLRWGLRLYWFLGLFRFRVLPWKMQALLPAELQKPIHINEQSVGSLRAALSKAGFTRVDLELETNPQYVYYFLREDRYVKWLWRLSRILPFKQLYCSELYAVAFSGGD